MRNTESRKGAHPRGSTGAADASEVWLRTGCCLSGSMRASGSAAAVAQASGTAGGTWRTPILRIRQPFGSPGQMGWDTMLTVQHASSCVFRI
ncbi:MAG: hypothetical protein IJ246_11580 [Clostridia bacterium]|nr:hypothetical protein [Clostridia bacterium]